MGYEDQFFATLRDPGERDDSDHHHLDVGDAGDRQHRRERRDARAGRRAPPSLRATAADGTTATYSLPTRVAVASGVAYPGNTEFGEPADADASDDFIVRHEQFTASYNPNRGTPNWVSYDLDAAHFGAEDRCDCFTMDPDLPASLPRIYDRDYTDAGAFHGYGIDRGHMARSFDRTTGSLDNARTYLFSNIVPQAADMNQGPWAILENDLGDLARVQDREVYIITGVGRQQGHAQERGQGRHSDARPGKWR